MNEGRIEQDGTPDAVVEHPATPFVMTFIGEVNIFRGRVQDGKVLLGRVAVDYPAHASAEAKEAVGYARPHELQVSRSRSGEGWPTVVRDVRIAGALVKVELVDGSDAVIRVELARDQYEQLHLMAGETVYVAPRRMRVFTTG
jgi:sulfate transport system ATP-binding protein